jgi:two-component system, OmpR family, response regulator
MNILLIEDEKKIVQFVTKALTDAGHHVVSIMRGDDGKTAATTQPYDLIILDLALPGVDGMEVLRAVRSRSISTPVLILTARGSKEDRIHGLDEGADDYLPKPFAMDELLARVNALTRRTGGQHSPILRVGDLIINETTRDVHRGTTTLLLSTREYSLLDLLMRHPGRIFTRTEICEHVWKSALEGETGVVDVYIQRLRKKVDEDFPTKLIQTIRNVGYTIQETSAVGAIEQTVA